MRFVDEATCIFEPVVNLNGLFNSTDLTGTDDVRVVFSGVGVLEFADCSKGDIPRDAFVGIQSVPACQSFGADIRFRIIDRASFHIGNTDCSVPGGVLQVGNTISTMSTVITFSLILDGVGAIFDVGPQGFFGAGVGIASKPAAGHNSWLVAPTSDVQKISFDLRSGGFRHSELYAGSDDRSSLIAFSDSVGNDTTQVFDFFSSPIFNNNPFATLLSNSPILGGGNFIAVANDNSTPFNPIVETQNGFIDARYIAGIFASSPLLQMFTFENVSAFEAQLLLRVQDILITAPVTDRGVAAPSSLTNQVRIGYVDTAAVPASEGFIGRAEVQEVLGKAAQTTVQGHSLKIGVAQINLTPLEDGNPAPRPVVDVVEIGS